MLSVSLLSLGLLLQSAQDRPTASPPINSPTTSEQPHLLDDIPVSGRRIEEVAREFVSSVADAPAGARVGRWTRPVCISVAGLRASLGQQVVDGVTEHARSLGLEAQGPGCTPNIIIVATHDGPAVSDALVRRWPLRFRPPFTAADRGLAALERFRNDEAAIRWWHVSLPVDATTGWLAARASGDEAHPAVLATASHRLKSPVRYDLVEATIVLDVSKIGNASFEGLIDHIAFVALAQVDPRSDRSALPTVLNLFQSEQSIDGMTEWDRSYLTALYTSRSDMATQAMQESEIAHALARNRRRAQSVND